MPAVITAQTQSENSLSFPIHWTVKVSDFLQSLAKSCLFLKDSFCHHYSNDKPCNHNGSHDNTDIFINKCRYICIQQWHALLVPTRHVDHPAVAVLHQVSSLTVDPAGRDAVSAEEVRVHRRGLAVPPRWRQVRELRKREATAQNHFSYRAYCLLNIPSCALLMQSFDLVVSVNMIIDLLLCLYGRLYTFIEFGTENESLSYSMENTCA